MHHEARRSLSQGRVLWQKHREEVAVRSALLSHRPGPARAIACAMDQPLWQNYLNLGLLAFVARRAALGLALAGSVLPPDLTIVYACVLGSCVLAGVGVWLKRGWVITSIVTIAIAFGIQTAIELVRAGPAATPWLLVTQLMAAWLWSALAVVFAMRSGPSERVSSAAKRPQLRVLEPKGPDTRP